MLGRGPDMLALVVTAATPAEAPTEAAAVAVSASKSKISQLRTAGHRLPRRFGVDIQKMGRRTC